MFWLLLFLRFAVCVCQFFCERAGALMGLEGYPDSIIVYYDEAARRSFRRRSMQNDAAFDIEKEVAQISPSLVLDAKALFIAAKVCAHRFRVGTCKSRLMSVFLGW